MAPKATIRNEVRRLRFENGEMTQQELAERIGCTRQTVIMLEQGRYVPSLALALKISRAFDVPVDDIFTLDD
jgi:putative transcriptional regulator